MNRFLLLLALALPLLADPIPTCPTESLDYYRNEFISGLPCATGPITYYNFGFRRLSSAGDILDDDITVKTNQTNDGLLFISSEFNQTFTRNERYYITYTADPGPRLGGEELSLDPPTGPVVVSKWICTDTDFDQTVSVLSVANATLGQNSFSCGLGNATPYYLRVTTNPGELFDEVIYDQPAKFAYVRMIIDFSPGTVAGLDAIGARNYVVPEPRLVFALAIGLAGLFLMVRRRAATAVE